MNIEEIFKYSFKQPSQSQLKEIENIFIQLDNHIIPKKYPKHMINDINCALRYKTIDKIGFSLVCKEWIKPLAEWIGNKRCLEVMAGCGSLSYALKEEEVNVVATDDFSWGENGRTNKCWNENKNYWTDIENLDAIESVNKYGKDIDIIFMSWAFMDDTAYRVLKTMREINPNCVIVYIGEGIGGCTADDEFYENIKEITDDEKFNIINLYYPRWCGIHDGLWLIK